MSEEAGADSQAQDRKQVGERPGVPAAPYAEGTPGLPPRYGIPGSRSQSRVPLPGEADPDSLGLESPYGWLPSDSPFGRQPEDASPTGALAPLPPPDMGASPSSAGLTMRPRLSSPAASSGPPTQPTPMVSSAEAASPGSREPGGPHGKGAYGRDRGASYGSPEDVRADNGPGGFDQRRTGSYADNSADSYDYARPGGYDQNRPGSYGQNRLGGYGQNRSGGHEQNGPNPYDQTQPDPYEQPAADHGHPPAVPGAESILSAPTPASARQITGAGPESAESSQHATVERTAASEPAGGWAFRGTRLFARGKASDSPTPAGGSQAVTPPPGDMTGSAAGQHAAGAGADAPGQRGDSPQAFGSTRAVALERTDRAGGNDRPGQGDAEPARVTSHVPQNRPGDDGAAVARTGTAAGAGRPSERDPLGGTPDALGAPATAAAAHSLARQQGGTDATAGGQPANRPEPPHPSTEHTATGHGGGGTQTSVLPPPAGPPEKGSPPPGGTQPAGVPPGTADAPGASAPPPAALSSSAAARPAGGARAPGGGPAVAARPTAVVKGRVQIADAVVEKVAALAAVEVSGVADLSFGSTKAREQGRDGGGAEQRAGGIRVVRARVEDRQVWIDVAIAIDYGAVVIEVANAVKANVARVVNHMLGLRVIEVNITVDDVAVPLPTRPGAHAGGAADTTGAC